MIYWGFLLFAIIAEVIGTVSMKYASVHEGMLGYFIMYVMIAISYICLSISIKRIALGVAYAFWEGIGTLFITGFGIILFGEIMSPLKAIGIMMLLFGIAMVKSGTKMPKQKPISTKLSHHSM